MRTHSFFRSYEMTLVAISIAAVVGLGVVSGGDSLTGNSTRVLLQYLAVPILIGLAQMVVLAVGELNLAVGAMGGFAAVATGVLMVDHGVPMPVAVMAGFGIATLSGLANGLLIVLTRISGFVVTLATLTILGGAQYWLAGSSAVSGYSSSLKDFGQAAIGGRIPVILVVALLVAVAISVFLHHARSGRRMLATGGNPVAARLSGISNDRSLVLAHTLSGAIVGVAAILTVASEPGVSKDTGASWLLPSFAAPIIGGALLTGGTVVVLGTVLAALILRLVESYRAEFGLETAWVDLVTGAVVLGTVVVGKVRRDRQRKAMTPPDPEHEPGHDDVPVEASR